jgi:hypothetical protein
MRGKWLITGLVAFTALFAVGLWYSQTYAFYERVNGKEEISFYGDPFPVSDYKGIDASTSPLKLRACFTAGWDYVATAEDKDEAEPLKAPFWFRCFDAESIHKDILADRASAIKVAENEVTYGFDRFIAHYPDGRGYMWRQINACGAAKFAGDPLPEGCPPFSE